MSAPPESVLAKVEAAHSRGEISRDEAVMYKTFSIFNREKLPQRFSPAVAPPIASKESTSLIRQLKKEFETTSPEVQEVIRSYLFKEKKGVGSRPAFKAAANGTGLVAKTVLDSHTLANWTTTANFNIEWGDDVAVNPADVARWAEYFETSWADMITTMGYALPKGSGTNLIDVYIGNTDSLYPISWFWYGYTNVYSVPAGVPFFVVNNTYWWAPPNDDPEGDVAGAMKVTAAHEFFHAVHLTIDYWEDAWWMEASSTWMEDAVYDQVNDYYNYIDSGFGWPLYPNVSLLLFNGAHEYGDVVWAKYLSEYWGGASAVKSVWDNCTSINGSSSVTATETFFESHTTTLPDAFKEFTIKNLFMDYLEGASYGTMAVRTSHATYPHFQDSRDLAGKSPDYLGTNYIRFDPYSGVNLTLSFDGDEYVRGREVQWGATVALKTLSGYSSIDIALDVAQSGSVTIDNYTAYESIHLVPAVLSPTGLTPAESSVTSYTNYPDGVPYAYDACIDCTPPGMPLLEFPENDSIFGSGGGGGGGGGCFIATAAFGYYDEPHVMVLRLFRDEYLMTNAPGRLLVNLYYDTSPPLAAVITKNSWLKGAVRIMLLPLIAFAWIATQQAWLLVLFTFIVLYVVILKMSIVRKTLSEQQS